MTTADDQIARQGLPRHPTPKVTAAHLRTVADALEDHGTTALRRARELAARGWPAGTLGTGSRSADPTTSVERALGLAASDSDEDDDEVAYRPPDDRWVDADRELARRWRAAFTAIARLHDYVADLVAHADDVDPIPAGTGECQACSTFCRPTKDHPDFRLKAGLCPRHYKAWRRSDLVKSEWLVRHRKDPDAAASDRPEPDAAMPSPGGCFHGHGCCDIGIPHDHWHPPSTCPACQLLAAAS